MSISVTTNVAALRALSNLRLLGSSMTTSQRYLADGFKISEAADDPSGLTVATIMTARVRGENVATQNAQDTINLLDTADAAMQQMESAFLRIRDLLVHAANEVTLTGQEQAMLIGEADILRTEVGRIAVQTTYNTKLILFGDLDPANNNSVQIGPDNGSGQRLVVGIPNLQVSLNGFLNPPPPPNPMANLTLQAQSGLSQVDTDISTLAGIRADLGTIRRRLTHIVRDLEVESVNQQAARSRLQDTDFAAQLANHTKLQILSQSTLAALAQANSSPNVAIQLLG